MIEDGDGPRPKPNGASGPAAGDHLQREVEQFLFREAELLDSGRLPEWLDLLTDDVDYRIPVRITRERAETDQQFSDSSFHMVEDRGSLGTRVARFSTESAWSENPPSRTRRFVSNVRLGPAESEVATLEVTSNLLLFWARENFAPVLLAGERHDRLRREASAWKLARRTVLLDHTTLPVPNLAVFL